MKLQNKLMFAVTATIFTSTAMSNTIDFRHEYKEKSEQHASRIKLSTTFNPYKENKNFRVYTSMEMKIASADKEDFLKNIRLTETELDAGVAYKVGNWLFRPGMPVAITPSKTTFKPQLRVVYKTDFGLTTALRYRHEFANYIEPDEGDTDDVTGEKVNRPQKFKVTLTGGYKMPSLPSLRLNYEANYVKSLDNALQFNGNDWEYDAGLIVGYQVGNWLPYAEVWSVDVDKETSERQVRYRAGLKYRF